MKSLRFWTVVVLLAGTALLITGRSRSEPNLAREPLSQLPNEMGGSEGIDQGIDSETLKVLGAGEFLSRVYVHNGHVPPISLFIAYFPTQRTGVGIHSPKHCLPGSGWVFESSQYVQLVDAEGKSHQAGEYIIANGTEKQFVIYWYEAHGRSVASEYSAMFHMISDSIRMNRSDGALVRVITPIGPDGDARISKLRAEAFVSHLAPILPRFIPD